MTLSDMEKLRILLPHWIEHNHSHETDFLEWAAKCRKSGQPKVSTLIIQAVVGLKAAEEALVKALDNMGGALPGQDPHPHDEHHHH